MRWTQEELLNYTKRIGVDAKEIVFKQQMEKLKNNKFTPRASTNKYNAVANICDGHFFPSLVHRDYYLVLKKKMDRGEIHYFLMEVPIRLPGAVSLRVDFLVFELNGEHDWIDIKGGKLTEAWRAKQKMVEALYPIKITLMRRKQVDEQLRMYGMM